MNLITHNFKKCARLIFPLYRLFDLVNIPDARYRTSFYHALRDTLVCSDLDAATSIAYGPTRYRVVTFDGQLIDASGTMSGKSSRNIPLLSF